ncbi:MAG TPA: YraN family protein [Candidatus Gracilibacteria bacterium]|nr:YraN family protein [Candidatus Gracilibacteria bacterium]
MHNQKIGKWGEEYTKQELIRRHWQIIAQNVFTPFGEIDIIAEDQDVMVFVEVKTRQNDEFGTAAEQITKSKKNHILKSCEFYIQNQDIKKDYRIDLATLDRDPQGNWQFDLIENAITYF